MRVTIRDALFDEMEGCSDGDCVITGIAQGQHTNGGCNCLSLISRGKLKIIQSRIRCIADKEIEI